MSSSQSSPWSNHDTALNANALRNDDQISWESTDLREFLDGDTRPTIVIDLNPPVRTGFECYANPAFDNSTYLRKLVSDETRDGCGAFQEWARCSVEEDKRYYYGGLSWSAVTIRRRWRVVSGNENVSISSSSGSGSEPETWSSGVLIADVQFRVNGCDDDDDDDTDDDELRAYLKKRRRSEIMGIESMPTPPGHDWTFEIPPAVMSPHVAMLRSHDWSQTPFGPMRNWSAQLRLMVNLLMCDPHPAVLFWGPSLAGIYNEAYVPFVTGKHPKSLGEPYRETWKEIYQNPETAKLVDGFWNSGYNTGRGTRQDHQLYHLLLNGQMYEKYFTLGMLPILGDSGTVLGFYEPLTDVTKDHFDSRRQLTVRKVSESTAGVQTLNDFYSKMLNALEDNILDIPYCFIWSIEAGRSDAPQEQPSVDKTDLNFAKLEGSVGVKLDDQGRPVTSLLSNDAFTEAFHRACRLGESIIFDIPPELTKDIMDEPLNRGFSDLPKRLVLCPIQPTTQKTTAAMVVLGLNNRASLDDDYENFIHSLIRSISTSLASVMLLNIASRKTLEAAHGEQIAKTMLAIAPVGVFLINLEGEVVYANPMWYSITEYNKYENEQTPMSWMSVIAEESREHMTQQWLQITNDHKPRSFESRLKKEWKGTDSMTGELIRGPAFILVEALIQSVDNVDYVTGCITDISRQKWAEGHERRRREEAVELKRQQENFIDMTSHEMRNPLSAIMMEADGIMNALSSYQAAESIPSPINLSPSMGGTSPLPGSTRAEDKIAYAIEAASTISLCAQHQKRIVDDVLVLSKVDANLLEVSPVDLQPHTLVEQSLRMFAAELSANDIHMEIHTDKTYQALGIQYVKLDPTRLIQILTNLCTNAIKFTSDSVTRKIQVLIAASYDPPTDGSFGLQWLKSDKKVQDPTLRPEWGNGQQLYLVFAVKDSGRGISEEEMKFLFQRFSQASPRTHTRYGGSGLGLFISRQLTQIQGGETGVVSTPGKGSTFAFYIKVRRGKNPSLLKPETNDLIERSDTPKSMTISIHSAPSVGSQGDHIPMDVLIVEDNIVNQKVLRRQLQNLHWTVHTANNGQEAIEFLKTSQFWRGRKLDGIPLTIVLMDIEMPIMNGTDAAKQIRQLERNGSITSHVPIIAITANARLEQINVARESGMDDVVSKPFRIPELVSKVEGLIGFKL